MAAKEYNILSHISGDTFQGVTFNLDFSDPSRSLTGASIAIDFRQSSPEGEIHKSMSVGTGITITNAFTNTFQIDKQIIDLEPGLYYYDVQVTFSNGDIKTLIIGTWKILNSITN